MRIRNKDFCKSSHLRLLQGNEYLVYIIRKYHINLSNPKSLIDNQILVLNALITTSKRIVGWQDGEIKYGQIDDSPSHHLLRLESYAPNFNWVITDIDNFMDGNPYY